MKLKHALLALMMIVPALASVGAHEADDARAIYRFDAADEEKTAAGSRVARDVTGNGYDARVAFAELVDGRLGDAYRFDGFGDFVRVPADVTHGLDQGTIAMFLHLDTVDEHQKVFVSNWPGSFTYLAITLDEGGRVRFTANENVQLPNLASVTPLEAGKWHHLAVTWSDAGRHVYIDGALDASDALSLGVGTGYTVSMLGNDPNAYWARGLWGVMDEVRFYDRALAAHEIAALAGEEPQPPVAHACVAWDAACVHVPGRALDDVAP